MRTSIRITLLGAITATLAACSGTHIPDKYGVKDLYSGESYETWADMGTFAQAGVWTFWDVESQSEQRLTAYDKETLIQSGWYSPESEEVRLYERDYEMYLRFHPGAKR